ncbi:MAG: hypothetical protein MJE66_17405 [Proteobacteria bacterium]|nr:hypothetical protein [Pseudomonadota bacterium]
MTRSGREAIERASKTIWRAGRNSRQKDTPLKLSTALYDLLLVQALEEADFNQTKAAELLGCSRQNIRCLLDARPWIKVKRPATR